MELQPKQLMLHGCTVKASGAVELLAQDSKSRHYHLGLTIAAQHVEHAGKLQWAVLSSSRCSVLVDSFATVLMMWLH